MAIDFSGDLDALYADTGVAATYELPLGGTSSITVVEGDLGDQPLSLSGFSARSDGAVLMVRVSELAEPTAEATLTISGRPVATVQSYEITQDRLEWICHCRVAA